MSHPAIRFKPADVRARLYELGRLTPETLLDACGAGLLGRNGCTPNHPRQAAGCYMWSETVAALGDGLAKPPFLWRRDDSSILSIVINESNAIAITVATGDEATGKEDRTPCTNSAKGPHTKDAVAANQYWLFAEIAKELEKAKADLANRQTWTLLVHYDHQLEELRAELSLPVDMTADGYVSGWHERIILTSIRFDETDTHRAAPDAPELSPEIN